MERFASPKFQAFDSNGDPLTGGKLYTYDAGTTDNKTTYKERTLETENANPIVLDSRGECACYFSGTIKLVLKTSAGSILWTMDNLKAGVSVLTDDDGDTMVQVEESADEDKIRADTGGTERAVLDANGLQLIGLTASKAVFTDASKRLTNTGQIVTAEIKDANVTAAKLASNAVETAKIKDANVTAAKLATNAVSLNATPDSDHTTDGIITTLTAGENLVFGNVCYMKSDGKLWKAQAGTEITLLPGIAMATATILADASGNFLLYGFARDDTWDWTIGNRLVVSNTAGEFKYGSDAAHYTNHLAVATHADRILFMPELFYKIPI